jgi:hypothetical protein
MSRKLRTLFALVGLLAAAPTFANILTSATATANCQGFSLSVHAIDLSAGHSYTIDYSFKVTCGVSSQTWNDHVYRRCKHRYRDGVGNLPLGDVLRQ